MLGVLRVTVGVVVVVVVVVVSSRSSRSSSSSSLWLVKYAKILRNNDFLVIRPSPDSKDDFWIAQVLT